MRPENISMLLCMRLSAIPKSSLSCLFAHSLDFVFVDITDSMTKTWERLACVFCGVLCDIVPSISVPKYIIQRSRRNLFQDCFAWPQSYLFV